MSAIKCIQSFIETHGTKADDENIFVFDEPIECGCFDILSVIDGKSGLEYAVDNEGYFFRYTLTEYYAFVILLALAETDEYKDVRFTIPFGEYDEFDYQTFKSSILNLKKAISYIERLVEDKKPLTDKEWRMPAMAMNMIMNDVKHYNQFIDESK